MAYSEDVSMDNLHRAFELTQQATALNDVLTGCSQLIRVCKANNEFKRLRQQGKDRITRLEEKTFKEMLYVRSHLSNYCSLHGITRYNNMFQELQDVENGRIGYSSGCTVLHFQLLGLIIESLWEANHHDAVREYVVSDAKGRLGCITLAVNFLAWCTAKEESANDKLNHNYELLRSAVRAHSPQGHRIPGETAHDLYVAAQDIIHERNNPLNSNSLKQYAEVVYKGIKELTPRITITEERARYDRISRTLTIKEEDHSTNTVREYRAIFKEDKLPSLIIKTLFRNAASQTKEWHWDVLYKAIHGVDSEDTAKDRLTIHEGLKTTNKSIEQQCGVSDFLIFTAKTCRVNPCFLQPIIKAERKFEAVETC